VDDDRIKLVSYIPHGAVPDIRGFAPSIVAYNLTRHLKLVRAVTICTRERFEADYEVDPEIGDIYRIEEGRIYRRLFRKITKLDPWPLHMRAAKITARVMPDVFHAHQLEFPVNDFLRRLRRTVPVLVHAHVAVNAFSAERGMADQYVAVSEYVREELIKRNYPSDKVTVIRNGVDIALFAPAAEHEKELLKKAMGIPAHSTVLSFVGRLQEVKGFHTFLEAAKILLPKHEDLHVLVVGPEPYDAPREKSYIHRNDMRADLASRFEKRYREFPRLSHKNLSAIYKITDISYLPSLSEPQGMTMIESMASGCITVSSNIGGIRESISHGSTGLLVNEPDNIGEGVQLIEDIMNNMEGYKPVKTSARRHIADNFDWKIAASRLEELYLRLCNA
jgi:glycosyltransferase involved in cell wall biosynthesis